MMRVSGFSLELDKCLCCGKSIDEESMYFPVVLAESFAKNATLITG